MTRFNHIEKRIRKGRLLEKIQKQKNYCKKIGLIEESLFHGELLKEKEN